MLRRHFQTLHDGSLKGLLLIFGGLVAFVAVTISVNIFLRLFGMSGLVWVGEVAEYAMYVGAFAAAPWVLRLDLHVRIDILSKLLPRGVARALDLSADAAGLVVCLFVAFYGALAAFNSLKGGSVIYKSLVIPEWPLLMVIPVSFALLGIEFLLRIVTCRKNIAGNAPTLEGF
ncbi:MAG TPA: TRAP transporter small permease [Bellilinea sp.]|nr:TRAP transporter small permease [Bellilinea sp.]